MTAADEKVITGKQLEDDARKAAVKYEQQDEIEGTQKASLPLPKEP